MDYIRDFIRLVVFYFHKPVLFALGEAAGVAAQFTCSKKCSYDEVSQSVFRNLKITERVNLEFSVEAFNLDRGWRSKKIDW